MSKKVLLAIAIMFVAATVANAVTLEVGAGKAYATVQDAIADCYGGTLGASRPEDIPGETILVYPGTYPGWNLPSNMHVMTIKAADTTPDTVAERVTFTGGVSIGNITNQGSNAGTYEGFFVASTHAASTSLYSISRYSKFNNIVVYGGLSGGISQYSNWGSETYNHVTVYNNAHSYSGGYQSYGSINNSIIANNGNAPGGTNYSAGVGNPGDDGYNIFYANGTGDPIGSHGSDATDLTVDPLFASTDPADDDFLKLNIGSPGDASAGDGGNRGALPTVPEPATLALLGLAGTFVMRRRRS